MKTMRLQAGPALILALFWIAACAPADQTAPLESGARTLENMEADELLRLADNFARAGEYETALKFYNEALRKDNSNANAYVKAANTFIRNSDVQGAEAAFKRALEIDNRHLDALAGLARLYIRTERPDDAAALTGPVNANGAGNRDTLNIQAIALDILGRHKMAQRLYARLLSEDPNAADVLSNMALSFALAEDYEPAREILTDLMDNADTRLLAAENLALVEALAGKPEKADRIIAEASFPTKDTENSAFYHQLAKLDPELKSKAVLYGYIPEQTAEKTADTQLHENPGDAIETEKADIPVYYVQLAALPSYVKVQSEWARLSRNAVLKGVDPLYASSDKRALLRLLIGPFQGFRAANAVCDDLKAQEISCFVVSEVSEIMPLSGSAE